MVLKTNTHEKNFIQVISISDDDVKFSSPAIEIT